MQLSFEATDTHAPRFATAISANAATYQRLGLLSGGFALLRFTATAPEDGAARSFELVALVLSRAILSDELADSAAELRLSVAGVCWLGELGASRGTVTPISLHRVPQLRALRLIAQGCDLMRDPEARSRLLPTPGQLKSTLRRAVFVDGGTCAIRLRNGSLARFTTSCTHFARCPSREDQHLADAGAGAACVGWVGKLTVVEIDDGSDRVEHASLGVFSAPPHLSTFSMSTAAPLRTLLQRACGSREELASSERVAEVSAASRSVLLHGTAASGKKSLVRAVADAEGVDVTLISPSALTDAHVAFLDACRLGRSVIIVDDFDVLFPSSAVDTSRSADHDATFAERWARLEAALASAPRALFVAVTRNVGRIAPAVAARFAGRLELSAPTPAARLRIMERCFEAANARVPTEAECEELAEVNARMPGMTAPDISRLFRFGALRALERVAEAGCAFALRGTDLASMLGRAKRAIGAGDAAAGTAVGAIHVPNVRWSDVGGLDDAKRRRAAASKHHKCASLVRLARCGTPGDSR